MYSYRRIFVFASAGVLLSTLAIFGLQGKQVTDAGRLYAYSADKGQKLLDVALGQNAAGPPMTFMFENKQYIAVMAGHGLPDAPAFASAPSGTPAVKPRLYVYVLDGKPPNPTPAP